jgi:polyhydroxyalkanoate synthesis regulator phasin
MSVINQAIVTNVIKSFEGEAKAIAKARTAQDKAIQAALDAMVIACDKPKALFLKGNAKTNEARGQIKAMFDAIVEKGFISKSSGASYQSAFWIAFEQGVEFKRDLNNKAKTEGESSEAKTSAKASGAVQSTSRKDLDKTLSKALAQARLLGLLDFAADVLDLCQDRLDGFEETILDK